MAEPSEVTIHLLSMGRALCGQMGSARDAWPAGHSSKELTQYQANPDATLLRNRRYCAACLAVAAANAGRPKK
jgi:hypothetical protein